MIFDMPNTLLFTVFWACQKSWLLLIGNSVPPYLQEQAEDEDDGETFVIPGGDPFAVTPSSSSRW